MMKRVISIQTCFNKASESYDVVAIVQRNAAQFLVNQVLNINVAPKTILDVGAGTGYISELLLKKLPNLPFI